MRRRARFAPWLALAAVVACDPPRTPMPPPLGVSAPPPASHGPPPTVTGPREPSVGPRGEKATLEQGRVSMRFADGREVGVEPDELHPPPGDRSLLGIAATAVLFLDDGTLLVGAGDGSVTTVDAEGHRRRSLGFRGAVNGFARVGEGLVAVTTKRGVAALMTTEGTLRWELPLTAEPLSAPIVAADQTIFTASQRGVFALSLGGELLFSHASSRLERTCDRYRADCDLGAPPALSLSGDEVVVGDGLRFSRSDPHPAVPSLVPTFALTFRREREEPVVSLLATPAGVLALSPTAGPSGRDSGYQIIELGGARTYGYPVPHEAAKREVFVDGTAAARATLTIDRLLTGPTGRPWIVARRMNQEKTSWSDGELAMFGGAGQILELDGNTVREQNDLFAIFSAHWLSLPIAAPAEGRARMVCFGEEAPTCVFHEQTGVRSLSPPAVIASVAQVGRSLFFLTAKGDLYRTDAEAPASFTAVGQPAPLVSIAGTSEADLWADFRAHHAVLHFDGTKWSEVPVPEPVAGRGFFVRARDDVWSGSMHWDGHGWSLVDGARAAEVALAKGRDDVWLGSARGLWHGSSPGPAVVRLPAPRLADEGALGPAAVLELGPADDRHAVEPITIDVAGGPRLTAAENVTAAPDGTLWLGAWDRLVELDGPSRGKLVRVAGRHGFGRWSHPDGTGKGIVLVRDERNGMDARDGIWRVDGGKGEAGDIVLARHDAVAVDGDPAGALWVVGAPAHFGAESRYFYEATERRAMGSWEEFAPHALVRGGAGGLQPVLGLPAAAWCDVAASPDGGAWFAGGLGDGPSGEGILFRARGRLGGDGTVRYRAPATLLAVAGSNNDEAWAVGAAGNVLHVTGNGATRLALPSHEWLRAVWVGAPDDVWLGGDGGTLLHYDGSAFRPVHHPLGEHAAITGIAAGAGALWAVGPSGIVRITKRP